MHKGTPADLDPTQAPTVFDIDVLRVARVYAEALFNAAVKADKVDAIWEQFVALVGRPLRRTESATDPVVGLVIAVPKTHRDAIVRKALAGRVDDLFLHFILVLNAHNRLAILRPVASVYRELMDERARKVRVRVTSAVPLTEPEREQLGEMVRSRFDRSPLLVETVDPAVLGGLRVQVGDRVIDATIRSRLDALKDQLLARGAHAIRR
jgi:F-type H+-transporting ATPase subunit delta